EGIKKANRKHCIYSKKTSYFPTLQNIAALRYVAAICPTVQAIVKLDDDVAWNIQDTRSIVDDAIRTGRIHCAKHVTEEEYSGKRYPPHCTGFAYVMSREAFLSILEAASEERYFWVKHIDDVFVTGVLANRSGVKHVGIWDKVSLYTKTLYHTWWSSNSTFTLVRKEDIETFFVITNADWMLKKYWYGSDNA
ncbi:N-acetyllactosaminide 3-alpha-galactosyltransferase, partial [Cooperia oncophora]